MTTEVTRGSKRVVRVRGGSTQVVLDPATVEKAGFEDGDIVEQTSSKRGVITLRKTGERKEKRQ